MQLGGAGLASGSPSRDLFSYAFHSFEARAPPVPPDRGGPAPGPRAPNAPLATRAGGARREPNGRSGRATPGVRSFAVRRGAPLQLLLPLDRHGPLPGPEAPPPPPPPPPYCCPYPCPYCTLTHSLPGPKAPRSKRPRAPPRHSHGERGERGERGGRGRSSLGRTPERQRRARGADDRITLSLSLSRSLSLSLSLSEDIHNIISLSRRSTRARPASRSPREFFEMVAAWVPALDCVAEPPQVPGPSGSTSFRGGPEVPAAAPASEAGPRLSARAARAAGGGLDGLRRPAVHGHRGVAPAPAPASAARGGAAGRRGGGVTGRRGAGQGGRT